MANPLKSMSLQELWVLFPIVLSPHQPQWADWAREEIATLSGLLAGFSPILNHIGSTAIPNIQAKPIIDILVEVPAEAERAEIQKILEDSFPRLPAKPPRHSPRIRSLETKPPTQIQTQPRWLHRSQIGVRETGCGGRETDIIQLLAFCYRRKIYRRNKIIDQGCLTLEEM